MTIWRVCSCLALLCALGVLPGCYKAQYETEKSRADDLDQKLKQLEAQAAQAKGDLAAMQGRIQQLETQLAGLRSGGTLVGYIDGEPRLHESIRWDGTQWIRHGDCERAGGVVKFENGRLSDQTLFIARPSGRPWFTGAVKAGRPDGEWIWFDDAGQPSIRETWVGGRLKEVARASTPAKGPLTWGRLNTRDREAWLKSVAGATAMVPELVRDTSPPPAPTPAPAGGKPAAAPR